MTLQAAAERIKAEFAEIGVLASAWVESKSRSKRWRAMTHAVIQGGMAAQIKACKPTIANPYQDSDYRWAWFTGFDLCRRMYEAMDEADELRAGLTLKEPTNG